MTCVFMLAAIVDLVGTTLSGRRGLILWALHVGQCRGAHHTYKNTVRGRPLDIQGGGQEEF